MKQKQYIYMKIYNRIKAGAQVTRLAVMKITHVSLESCTIGNNNSTLITGESTNGSMNTLVM